MSIDFTSLQREFFGLLAFAFQLVRTNVAENIVKIPDLNIIIMLNGVNEYFLRKRCNVTSPEMTSQAL